jgi:hypothetical protein
MSDLISPIVGQQPTVPDLDDFGYAPFRNVQPFSQRAASGYQETLEQLVAFVQRKLIPYLTLSNPQGQWDANAVALVAAVNAALVDQTADNAAKVQAALTAIANSEIIITDPAILAVLNKADSATRAWLDTHYAQSFLGNYWAPAPNGADDTAAVLPVLLAAQSTHGTMRWREGQYTLNVATAQSFVQPKIIGLGKGITTVRPFDKSKPAITLQGGSGGESGGYLSDFTFAPHASGGGLGLALQDVCNVNWDRLGFAGLDEAIIFAVTQDLGFTEFCHGEATIQAGNGLALHYKTTKTSETSFHGSGLSDGIINYSGPYAVVIDPNCFPYNAPFSCTVFTQTANTQVIRNRNVNREVSFFGTFRFENQNTGYSILGATGDGHGRIIYVGEFSGLDGPCYFGNLYFADAILYDGGNTFKKLKRWSTTLTLSNGTVGLPLMLAQGEHATVLVEIDAPGWASFHLLSVYQPPAASTARVAVITQEVFVRANSQADPTFSGENAALNITDVSFNNGYTAKITVTPDHNGFNAPMSQN